MYDLGIPLLHILDREAHGAFHSVELVIEAGARQHHHRRGDSQPGKLGGEVVLEHIFHALDGLRGTFHITEQVAVVSGDEELHLNYLFLNCNLIYDATPRMIISTAWLSWQSTAYSRPISLLQAYNPLRQVIT